MPVDPPPAVVKTQIRNRIVQSSGATFAAEETPDVVLSEEAVPHSMAVDLRSSQSLALTGSEEEMPVLEAFRQFLDAERKRSQRRVVAISIVFTFIIIGVVAAMIVVGTILHQNMKRDIARVEATAQKESFDVATTTSVRLREMWGKLDDISETIRNQQRKGDHAVALLSLTESNLVSQAKLQKKQTDHVLDSMEQLRADNERLREQFSTVSRALEMMHQSLSATSNQVESLRGQSASSTPASLAQYLTQRLETTTPADEAFIERTATDEQASAAVRSGISSIGTVIIAPDGAALPWLLMVPE